MDKSRIQNMIEYCNGRLKQGIHSDFSEGYQYGALGYLLELFFYECKENQVFSGSCKLTKYVNGYTDLDTSKNLELYNSIF